VCFRELGLVCYPEVKRKWSNRIGCGQGGNHMSCSIKGNVRTTSSKQQMWQGIAEDWKSALIFYLAVSGPTESIMRPPGSPPPERYSSGEALLCGKNVGKRHQSWGGSEATLELPTLTNCAVIAPLSSTSGWQSRTTTRPTNRSTFPRRANIR